MSLLAKSVMKKDFKLYLCNDSIQDVANEMIVASEDLIFIQSLEKTVIGYCKTKDLLKGVLQGLQSVQDVMNVNFAEISKSTLLSTDTFSSTEMAIVVNDQQEMIGYIQQNHVIESQMKLDYEERKKYKQIFDAVHNGILAIDANGRISAINPAAAAMAKTTSDQAIGKLLNEVVITKGLLKVIRTGEPHSEKYMAGRSKYLAHRTPIYDGKKLIGAVGVFQKLSEIETISEELYAVQDLEKEIQTIIEAIPEGVCILDHQGNIIKKNQAFAEKYVTLFENSEHANAFREAIGKVISKKNNFSIELASMEFRFTVMKNNRGELDKIICVAVNKVGLSDVTRKYLKSEKLLEWTVKQNEVPAIVAKSKTLRSIIRKVNQISQLDIPVCITGEKGTNVKELCFEIVRKSSRKDKPVIEFHCEHYSEEEQERLLFGTSSNLKADSIGLLDCLDGGTLIIYRLEKMTINCQNKLLHFIKGQESDVRIIVTLEGKLEDTMKAYEMNEELYYLLNVTSIYLPSLADRKEDISILIEQYLEQFEKQYKKTIKITEEAKNMLEKKIWLGNELELLELLRKAYFCSENDVIDEDTIHIVQANNSVSASSPIVVRKVLPLKDAVDELEKQLILKVKETEKSYRKIAKILDVDASTIARKMKKLEIADVDII